MRPVDLFMLHRVIVLVEGLHDEVVLDSVIGHDLAMSRSIIVPMRGGKNLPLMADSALIARFSSAPVLVVLDNLRMAEINPIVADLRRSEGTPGADFDAIVSDRFNTKEAEQKFLKDLLRNLWDRGQVHRFHTFGLEEIDVPRYLPAEAFGLPTWEEMDKQRGDKAADKPWIQRTFGVYFDEDNLRDAAAQLVRTPVEFRALAAYCADLSDPRPRGPVLRSMS